MISLTFPTPWFYLVDVEVCNQGQSWTPFTVQLFVYHTPDTGIEGVSMPGFADAYQGYLDVPMLAPSGCFQGQVAAWAAGPQPQPGYLAATIDEMESIVELIETNNELLGAPLEHTP